MTKILIFSDLHYASGTLRGAIETHPEAEYAIFLGDGLRKFRDILKDYPKLAAACVKGNCDLAVDYDTLHTPVVQSTVYEGVRVFFCHGHTFKVKDAVIGVSALTATAKKDGARIALFGHTHRPFCEEYDYGNGERITVFNPGSIGDPPMGTSPSYGVLTVNGEDFEISHETV